MPPPLGPSATFLQVSNILPHGVVRREGPPFLDKRRIILLAFFAPSAQFTREMSDLLATGDALGLAN